MGRVTMPSGSPGMSNTCTRPTAQPTPALRPHGSIPPTGTSSVECLPVRAADVARCPAGEPGDRRRCRALHLGECGGRAQRANTMTTIYVVGVTERDKLGSPLCR